MNQIERRTLIGAAGIGAIAALSKAGPINPPAGPVTGTGRTTDEIYNRIPAGGAGDGRTAIAGGNSGVSIAQPGSYVLMGNINVTGNALAISAPGVTLDLNGFRITSTSTGSTVISVSSAAAGLVIRNGSIVGGGTGIGVTSGAVGVRIEDVHVSGVKFQGINFSGSSSHSAVIRRCAVHDLGLLTIATDSSFVVQGISAGSGIGCRVESCTVAVLEHNGTPPVVIRGILVFGAGGSIDGCVVANPAVASGSLGIAMGTGGVYRNNKVHNFNTPYLSGTDGGGNF